MQKLLLSILAFVTYSMVLQAQEYSMSTTSIAYTELSNPISVNEGLTWDDPDYEVPIGFNYDFMGSPINTLVFADLGGSLFAETPEAGALLYAYGADVVDRGADVNGQLYVPGSLSPISYQLEGQEGSRIFKLEWKNVGFYSDVSQNGADATDYVNFQLWLFEDSGNWAVHHGPRSITNPEYSFDEEGGSFMLFTAGYDSTMDILDPGAMIIYGDPSDPIVFVTEEPLVFDDGFNFDGVIPENTQYLFGQDVNVGIEQSIRDQSLELHPNPASHYFTIQTADQEGLKMPIQIYTAAGKLVKVADPTEPVQVSDLAEGLYIIQSGLYRGKLVVQ